ncbi:hypothetical protein ACIPR8_06995 [Stenotrophomonas sp. LARHCG68]
MRDSRVAARLSALAFFASLVAGLFAGSDWLALTLLVSSVTALAVLVAARWRLDRAAEARHEAGLQGEGS